MNCIDCGKHVKHGFIRCYDCHIKHQEIEDYKRYAEQTPQERQDELEAYYNRECVMCGKEGAYPRKDGQNYCTSCWTIWNS